jgi:hypothetical protein
MRDQGLIYAGLAVFLGLITFPVSYNLAAGKTSKPPELQKPAEARQCVASVDYMRRSHMDLLIDWRDLVVRDGVRKYKGYEISLTNTCMRQCHTSKQEFCDRCHAYVGVQGPYCMDCHVDPRQIAEARR